MHEGALERLQDREARLAVALLRVALIPTVALGEVAAGRDQRSALFVPLLAFAALYAALTLWSALRAAPRSSAQGWFEAVADIGLLCALIYASGGAESELRKALFLVPLSAAFVARPQIVAAWGVATVAGFVGLSALSPESGDTEAVLTHALYLTWAGIGAVLLAVMLTRRGARVAELAATRGRLVQATLEVEARERRRLAEALHDEPLQNVLLARQELSEARRGRVGALDAADSALKRTAAQLREELFNLHPQVLDSAGLEAAIGAVAAQQARVGGFEVTVDVVAALRESRDELLLTLARELLINAARHARAQQVRVSVLFEDGRTVLEVVDDGCGMPDKRLDEAQAEGHIGLAAAAERARARGGRLRLRSTPGGGTRVHISLPA